MLRREGVCVSRRQWGMRQGLHGSTQGSKWKRLLGRRQALSPNIRGKRLFHRRPSQAWCGNRTGEVERTFSESSCPAIRGISPQPAAEGRARGIGTLPGQPGLFPACRPQTGHFLPETPRSSSMAKGRVVAKEYEMHLCQPPGHGRLGRRAFCHTGPGT